MRTLTVVLMAVAACVGVVGCGQPKQEVPPMDQAEVQAATGVAEKPVVVEPMAPPAAASKKATGKVAVVAPVAPAPTTGEQTYTVKAGDTLYTLAKRFYGDGKLWTKIADANKDKIKDVSHVPVGSVLVIPAK